MDIVRRKLLLVTIGTSKVNRDHEDEIRLIIMHLGKFHFTFFTSKVNTIIFSEEC